MAIAILITISYHSICTYIGVQMFEEFHSVQVELITFFAQKITILKRIFWSIIT